MGRASTGGTTVTSFNRRPRPTFVRATAYSKITLSLKVLGLRKDGYHEIEALTVSATDPSDVIEVSAVPQPSGVSLTLEGDIEYVPPARKNLAVLAAEALMVQAGRSGHGVHMVLRKKIPAGAGLGGGSADAAAALHAVRQLLEIDVDGEDFLKVALKIGSDVPFCCSGGAAWIRGRGEIIEPVSLVPDLPLLVVIPPFRLATPEVFAAWDSLGGSSTSRRIPAPDPINNLMPELFNDLELAAEVVEPRLREFRQIVERVSGLPAVLAGSGSAYIIPLSLKDAWHLDEVAEELRRVLRVPVATARTADRGVRIARI